MVELAVLLCTFTVTRNNFRGEGECEYVNLVVGNSQDFKIDQLEKI